MHMKSLFLGGVSIVAAMLVPATPVLAQGKADRAREAIAAASAKIDAANKVGATGEVPRLQAEAQAALRTAQEELASGKKDAAIADANRAAELADTAIGIAHRNQVDSERAATASAADAAANAQAEAAAANARADAAQQAAVNAQADAAAARAAPPPPPPPQATTVTTETVKEVAPATTAPKRKVVHRVIRRAPTQTAEKTTTTVTTAPQ